jgi:hypothetical protein
MDEWKDKLLLMIRSRMSALVKVCQSYETVSRWADWRYGARIL